jgi:hypothetical protein
MFVGLMSVQQVSVHQTLLQRDDLTSVNNLLVMQISEAGESILDDRFPGGRIKGGSLDVTKILLEIWEDEYVPLGNAVHCCPHVRRVLDVFL